MEAIDNSFEVTLRELRRGRCMQELSENLAALVEKVKETGKSGNLTLKLKVQPATQMAEDCVTVEDDVTAKLPKPSRKGTLFYPTEDNRLSREDPRQQSFEFRTIEGEQPEPRDVNEPSQSQQQAQ